MAIKYECHVCGKGHVKLWRDVSFVATSCTLLCAEHVLALDYGSYFPDEESEGPKTIDSDGYSESWHGKSDQINGMLPAVPESHPDPNNEVETFWGYTSVPQRGVAWWRALPNS
jgi:hypothetical protein